jgi:hypothetical protein
MNRRASLDVSRWSGPFGSAGSNGGFFSLKHHSNGFRNSLDAKFFHVKVKKREGSHKLSVKQIFRKWRQRHQRKIAKV